ncbi:MAG: hypothetical protein WAO20_18475 [Acidobacteriota bacterium]
MRFWFLVVALVLLLGGALSESVWLLAAGGVSLLSGLAWWGGAPRRPVLLFGCWTAGVLAVLLWSGTTSGAAAAPFLGLPWTTVWMLVGIWLAPLLIWPLSFLLGFHRWKER